MKLGRKKKSPAQANVSLAHYDLIRAPIITEKSTMANEQGKYQFRVSPDATKPEVKAAVEALFNVKVTKVNIINQIGKTKRFKASMGKQSDMKKAVVTLATGQSIDLAAGVK